MKWTAMVTYMLARNSDLIELTISWVAAMPVDIMPSRNDLAYYFLP
jgi:hypothetical protein